MKKLEDIVICDLDGTLALFGNKNPYRRDFINDEINEPLKMVLSYLYGDYRIIFFSGRSGEYRHETVQWLHRELGWLTKDIEPILFMRQMGDKRKDVIVKREMYHTYIEGKYNVFCVFDDRPVMVKMWREEMGFFVFDCNQSGKEY